MTSLPGLAVNIESSGDLTNWSVVGGCVVEAGTNYYLKAPPPDGVQFFRAHAR